MSLKLYNLRPAKGAKKSKKRIGRGNASGHGTYSTRGLKGQRARSGGKGGLKLKGLKGNIQSIPKLGGFKSLRPKLEVVNLRDLDKNFKDNEIVNIAALKEKELIRQHGSGVKILGSGKITKKLVIKIDKISNSALEAIKKAGGKVLTEKKPASSKEDKADKK